MPFISIFIPAYKNVQFLERLLVSIHSQVFDDYELIITDDSPDVSVAEIVHRYQNGRSNWHYYRNSPSLGMPQNWNYGLSLCQGEWIKIMHDDDWFSDENSLGAFAEAAQHTRMKFIFSAYRNVYEDGKIEEKIISEHRKKILKKQSMTLLSDNIIGPPSVCMVHRTIGELYDDRLKWRVDIDYYIRALKKSQSFEFVPKFLINVGISDKQVTQEVKYNKKVEIPEALILIDKYGIASFRNIYVYDSWWRFVRNLEIKNTKEFNDYKSTICVPEILQLIVKDVNKLSPIMQHIGLVSKFTMLLSYLKNYNKINA